MTRTGGAVLVGLVMVLALPTATMGQGHPDQGVAAREGNDGLVRVHNVHDGDGLALRRDGSKAVPFIARASGARDNGSAVWAGGFDWRDAGIGAAAALFAATAGLSLSVALRRSGRLGGRSSRVSAG